jgi:PHD/YefM family antitoxin component YafN of YafNO toxin-antitoxin module
MKSIIISALLTAFLIGSSKAGSEDSDAALIVGFESAIGAASLVSKEEKASMQMRVNEANKKAVKRVLERTEELRRHRMENEHLSAFRSDLTKAVPPFKFTRRIVRARHGKDKALRRRVRETRKPNPPDDQVDAEAKPPLV